MARGTRRHQGSEAPSESPSSSSSPERPYEDDEFVMVQPNDSQSSLGVHGFRDMSVSRRNREPPLPPVNKLPSELLIGVFTKLSSPSDLRTCMLVSRTWAMHSVSLLWHRPQCTSWRNMQSITNSVSKPDSYFAYEDLIKRLNLGNLAGDVNDGTLHSVQSCKKIERLTLTNCQNLTDSGVSALVEGNDHLLALDVSGIHELTDATLLLVAQYCRRLQGLNVSSDSKITDVSMSRIAAQCKHLKRLKLNECNLLTDLSVVALAEKCSNMLEIDLHKCALINDISVSTLLSRATHLRELRLAGCELITDEAFTALTQSRQLDSLRILDLTSCERITDISVRKIIELAPRLRNLVLAKCRNITDVAVTSIARLGKNLHYVHLGHCGLITDKAILHLIKTCNRIRYIDLACCTRLTDESVQQLANLPKLRRIGLVKCQNITDRSILALAKARLGSRDGLLASNLERVHLSYCTHLTIKAIHTLLISCPKLTHLSLTGVPQFLREAGDLTRFCREAPKEFTPNQRGVFCVFSNDGVKHLLHYLDEISNNDYLPRAPSNGGFYEDGPEDEEEDQQVAGMLGATAIHEDDPDAGADYDELIGEASDAGVDV